MHNENIDSFIDSLFNKAKLPDKISDDALTADNSVAFLRAVLTNPKTQSESQSEYRKVVLRPVITENKSKDVLLKPKQLCYLVESFTKTQSFQKTLTTEQTSALLKNASKNLFKQALIETSEESITILVSKKGAATILRKACGEAPKKNKKETVSTFNCVKEYLIPEGVPVPFLVHLGVMTEQGKVVAAQYDKFRQINRFLEYIDDVLPEVLSLIANSDDVRERPLRIADFGCGKSYLTFATHYFLTEIKKIPVEIIGLDLKKDVIALCNSLSLEFKCKGLRFEVGNIAGYSGIKPDIVITLHACDTATDYALEYAVKQNAAAILSVPCCQHEINAQIDKKAADKVFEPILKYGIIKERFSALVTDALRAEKLEENGYKVQLLEFIDMTHTPKNILIRAVKKRRSVKPPCSSYSDLCNALKIEPAIGRLLN